MFRFIKKIKKEKSVFSENKYKENTIKKYNLETDTLLHYFIRNKYFAQFNLSEYFFNPLSENKDISIISLSRIDFANSKINEKSFENELKILDNENNKDKSNQSNVHLSNLKNNPMYKNIGISKLNKQYLDEEKK